MTAATPSGPAMIATRGLARTYKTRTGPVEAVRGVDLRVAQGEIFGFLGPNGAGKTTTIEILEGFRMRSAGHVRVLGLDPAHGTERWRARLGVVLQSWRDHGKWRVRELLAHLGTYYAPYSTPRLARPWDTEELIEAVGLTAHADKRVGQLSGEPVHEVVHPVPPCAPGRDQRASRSVPADTKAMYRNRARHTFAC